jgi:hypothetical protein
MSSVGTIWEHVARDMHAHARVLPLAVFRGCSNYILDLMSWPVLSTVPYKNPGILVQRHT